MPQLTVNGVIYKIHNISNNKVYIGQTVKIGNTRFNNHIYDLNKGKHHNQHLQRSWDLYGKKMFVFEIVEKDIALTDLDTREAFWINSFDSTNIEKGYNISAGGQKNRLISLETRKKISKSLLGNSYSKGKTQNLSDTERLRRSIFMKDFNKTKVVTKETREKISKTLTGRVGVPQLKGKDSPLYNKPNIISSKNVHCINNNTTYRSITIAAKELNCDRSSISKVCKGLIDSIKGLKFTYGEEKCLN